jgi:hypothetical protein
MEWKGERKRDGGRNNEIWDIIIYKEGRTETPWSKERRGGGSKL